MKPATYTNEQIIGAGMQLLADNRRVTPFGIRNLLGGGNPTRIRAVWEASQQTALESQLVAHKVELPAEFSGALEATKGSLDELAKRMYGRAQEIAESRVRESIAAARKAQETAEAEILEAMDAVEQLDNENARLLEGAGQLRDELKRLNADNSRLQERLGSMAEKADKATQEAKDEKSRNRELERQLTINETQANGQQATISTLQDKLEAASKAQQQLGLENATLKSELKNTETAQQALSGQLAAAQQRQTVLEATRDQAKAGQQETQQQLAILQARLDDTTNREAELKQRMEKSQQAEEQAKATAAELKGRLAALAPNGTARGM